MLTKYFFFSSYKYLIVIVIVTCHHHFVYITSKLLLDTPRGDCIKNNMKMYAIAWSIENLVYSSLNCLFGLHA